MFGSVLPKRWCVGLAAGAAIVAAVAIASVAASDGEPAHAGASPGSPEPVRYARDIRRLLSDRCFQCHGPDAEKRAAGLRLDEASSATGPRTEKGKTLPPAIVPGHADSSELWKRISSSDPAIMMPPPGSNKRPLSPEEKGLLKRWIDQGAVYEPHWAFVAPVRPTIPQVRDASWPTNAIDTFVLANLEQRGVTPSPEADRATLARRVFLDITGLPPTLDELEAFERDDAPGAYGRLVDRLLNEEPYQSRMAERLATPWLDAARYADTCGIHTDNGRQAWLYREWVLEAFRDNMPFDQFLREQLAGDLLPDATLAQKVASGFNRMHVTTDEGGAIPEEYLVEYAVDRASTTSSVFLGLTLACARCHDHKFDPISMEDFYGLYAFFGSIDEPGLYSQTADAERAYEPFIRVPSPEQESRIASLDAQIAELDERLEKPWPGESEKFAAFESQTKHSMGVSWHEPRVVNAASSDPASTASVATDGTVRVTGPVPDTEDLAITLGPTAAAGGTSRLLAIHVVPSEGAEGKIGRSENGNAVVTGVLVESRPAEARDAPWTRVPIRWAWADYAQANGDFEPGNVLDVDDPDSDSTGWALGGHLRPGPRMLVLLADHPFGGSGQELRVTIQCRSIYQRHSLAGTRLMLGSLREDAEQGLPAMLGRWSTTGPIDVESSSAAYDSAFGIELATRIDPQGTFGHKNSRWRFDESLVDGAPVTLPGDTGVTYLARWIWAPSARTIEVSLGSDDGFRLFVNAAEVAGKKIDRSLAPDQDRATIPLKAGANLVVLKIVNTGGPAGYAFRVVRERDKAAQEAAPATGELDRELVGVLLPAGARAPEVDRGIVAAWRRTAFPEYLAAEAQRDARKKERGEIEQAVPLAMVMKELDEPRETFVLTRGQYDKPDGARPVKPSALRAIGRWPVPRAAGLSTDAERRATRADLTDWMLDPEHPLVARVAVNRLWEMVFGTGLVRTSEDFGQQGEWPSHPELLDWLAVDFRENGWGTRRMLRMMMTSATYRQSSRVRTDVAERDADNRWLSYYPRRRLAAEQVRDLALAASGLVVERFGGPSVKTYHPAPGEWKEIALPNSNTQDYTRGTDEDLWRRSLYTYWKRSAPPPSLMLFDAPTREACVIRRPITSTPLQALALMNDEQILEAARALAALTLEAPGTDADRLRSMFRRCTARMPDAEDLTLLASALDAFRRRFADAPEDATGLLAAGTRPAPEGLNRSELAAWTMIASSILNLHETLTQD